MKTLTLLQLALALFAFTPGRSEAYDQIVRPFMSVRSLGMGSTRIMTGLYEENFFGNPARASANPTWRVTVFDLTTETTRSTVGHISDLGGSGDSLQKIADAEGDNLHARIQTAFPAVYVPLGRMSYALALLTNTQMDMGLRRSYNLDGFALTDIGPAFTVARKFLPDANLSVGLTSHITYRLSSKDGFSLVDVVRGVSLAPAKSGGQGSHYDFDVGSTYAFTNFKPAGFKFAVGGAVNNILGGKYKNLHIRPVKAINSLPRQQPRTYNVGVSVSRESLLMLGDTMFALEVTDLGNNPNGSLYRTLHLGGETHFSILAPRVGINQGYLAAGLGIDLKIFQLDLATYGEEMTLNPGGLEDRRYALRLGFQI